LTLKNILSQPFPDEGTFAGRVKVAGITGFFVAFFLFVFQPFNMGSVNDHMLLQYSVIFGFITFGICVIFEFFAHFVLRLEKDLPSWIFLKWLALNLLLVTFIALANYIYFMYITRFSFSFYGLGSMIISTATIAVFPITFIGFIRTTKLRTKNEILAKEINFEKGNVTKSTSGTSNSDQAVFEDIPIREIAYVAAMQNYITVHYTDEAGAKSKTIRATLKEVETELHPYGLERCHRSYIVNKSKITDVTGNAQGLQLSLEGIENTKVSVSRKYISIFRP